MDQLMITATSKTGGQAMPGMLIGGCQVVASASKRFDGSKRFRGSGRVELERSIRIANQKSADRNLTSDSGIISEDAAPAGPAAPPVLVAPASLGKPGALNFITLDFSALDLSDGCRIAEDNVELQWNRGLLGFALVALFGHF